MISVLTPTIREEGLPIVKKALDRQIFRDFEWIIGSPFKTDSGIWVEDDFELGVWTLNRAYNKMIKQAKGDLIVSWQDFTFADPDCLERFWNLYRTEPKTLVSAVGNKYEQVYPARVNMVWKDPRENDNNGSYYPCYFNDIEANLASIPTQAFYDVGGFDEELDFRGFGMDFYSVADRLSCLGGWDFKINQAIKSYSLVHGRVNDWEKNNLLHGGYKERKNSLINEGVWPRLNYLGGL